MMTDIEIAQSVKPRHILEIAREAGVDEKYVELYGNNKAKLDLSEFLLLCREQGYFDLDEIQLAVFEHNGKLSVLPRAASRPATPTDLGIPARMTHVGVEVIMDGRVMGENLGRMGLDERWLASRLKSEGYRDAREIFLAVYRKGEDKLTLYPNVTLAHKL